jgi:hypothetical protein
LTIVLLLCAATLFSRAAASLYWTEADTGNIGQAKPDGSKANPLFITGLAGSPRHLVADRRYLYWSIPGGNAIGRANLDGTHADETFISGASNPVGIAIDHSHIYWGNSSTHTIGRADLDGGNVDQSFISTTQNGPVGVAVDNAHIYWSNFNRGTIGRAGLGGGSVNQSFIGGAIDPQGVVVTGSHVYWTGQRWVGRSKINGTDVRPLFIETSDFALYDMALDNAHIYWANATGKISRANLDGTDINESLIATTGEPNGVAVTPSTAVVTVSGRTLLVTAAPGAKDNLAISRPSPSTIRVTDYPSGPYTGARIRAGASCTPSGGYTVNCNAANVIRIQVIAGDQADKAVNSTGIQSSLYGGKGQDMLIGGWNIDNLAGGQGTDAMKGMNGNDLLFARDGTSDTTINCDGGATPGGADKADLDLLPKDPNSVVTNCETKTRH